jgi:hypothetical protein
VCPATPLSRYSPLPFVQNTDSIDRSHAQIESRRSDTYWGAYVQWGFQGRAGRDADGDREDVSIPIGTTVQTAGNFAVSFGASAVFLEVIRDRYGANRFQEVIWATFAHEVGHQFGLSHRYGGLMNKFEIGILTFADGDLDRLRDGIESPGNRVWFNDDPI